MAMDNTAAQYETLSLQAMNSADNVRNRDTYHGDRDADASYQVKRAHVYAMLAVAAATEAGPH